MAETQHTKVSLNLGVSLTLPVEHFLVGCNAGAHRHTHPIYSFYKLAVAKARGFAVSYQQITE